MTYNEICEILEQFGISRRKIGVKPNGVVDVQGHVDLAGKKLTKLPLQFGKVTGNFYCSSNRLTSLEGAPQAVGDFYCNGNRLTTLEGAPQSVGVNFYCFDNHLTSLEGAPQSVSNFYCSDNQLTSLEGIHKIMKSVKYMNFANNSITSHALGLLLIKDLKEVRFTNKQLTEIMNKHLEGNRDIIDCTSDLIDAGLDDFAKL